MIRPIQADDRERLQLHHERLSPESRYRRFMASKPQLSDADARYLVDIDGRDHFALVATTLDREDETIVAVARFVRLPSDRDAAEFAIVVSDPYQRQGLAGALIERLAEAAAQRGVRRFVATALADNLAIHHLLDRVGTGDLRVERLGSISELAVDLAAAPPAIGPAAPVIRRAA